MPIYGDVGRKKFNICLKPEKNVENTAQIWYSFGKHNTPTTGGEGHEETKMAQPGADPGARRGAVQRVRGRGGRSDCGAARAGGCGHGRRSGSCAPPTGHSPMRLRQKQTRKLPNSRSRMRRQKRMRPQRKRRRTARISTRSTARTPVRNRLSSR